MVGNSFFFSYICSRYLKHQSINYGIWKSYQQSEGNLYGRSAEGFMFSMLVMASHIVIADALLKETE